jgi:hypothetical protein
MRTCFLAPPYCIWIEAPTPLFVLEGGTARFACKVGGFPQPVTEWLVDGVRVEDLPADARRSFTPGSITFRNVTLDDDLVVECKARCNFGYISSKTFLEVLREYGGIIQ